MRVAGVVATQRRAPRRRSRRLVVRSETNQRSNNEDSYQVLILAPPGAPRVTLLAVADGMGGHANGEDVSREALRKIALSLFEELCVEATLNVAPAGRVRAAANGTYQQRVRQAMVSALEQANRHVCRMVQAAGWGKAGTTVVLAAIAGDTALVANVGDSPCYHYRAADGQAVKVTEDHSVAAALLRARIISAEMARVHAGRSMLELYLGRPDLPREVPLSSLRLNAGDRLLLCSDGVSGTLNEDRVASILREAGDFLDVAADSLLAAAREAGETDNQTLILWRRPGGQSRPVHNP